MTNEMNGGKSHETHEYAKGPHPSTEQLQLS